MSTFMGLAVPLYPSADVDIKPQAADVTIAIQAHASQSANLFEFKNSSGTAELAFTKNFGLLPKVRTTKPTTGLTKGELLLIFHNSGPKLGVCSSTAAQTIKFMRFRTKTLGRLTA